MEKLKINRLIRSIFYLITSTIIILTGCSKEKEQVDTQITPKAIVTLTSVRKESVNDTIFLTAISQYYRKTIIQASLSGYVTKVNVTTGGYITKGDLAFEMISKEYQALNSSKEKLDTMKIRNLLGKTELYAPVSGQVMDLNAQEGMYMQEGAALCSIVNVSDLYFNLFVPVEYGAYFSKGKSCMIILPSGQRISGTISNLLSKAESNSQSETYLLKPGENLIIPEGINVKVYALGQQRNNTQLLPKGAVLANETLDKYWVMKLSNDSTAVKIPVRTGITSGDMIEILGPQFSRDDKILLSGNYGLPDTALVTIQTEKDEQ
ncbi:MAG: HlyD family efflux transporter periplasmic adaptor subunit [Ignavibacteria bacterium]|jgi:multidrug efflux pump subunit AcrA (membrane-fusion protein)